MCLTPKEKKIILEALNFNNLPVVELPSFEFVQLREFHCRQSQVKPKSNRLSLKDSVSSPSQGIFLSWKKEQNLLFSEGEQVSFQGVIVNQMHFSLRLHLLLFIQDEQLTEVTQQ